MSSKTTLDAGAADSGRAQAKRGWSLAAHLTAWFACTTFALILIATGVLHWTLARYLGQKGMDRSLEGAILAQHLQITSSILGGAFVVCVLIGYWIARRGMRPVQKITQAAMRIRPSTLYERIDAKRLPAELAELAGTFNGMLDRLEQSFNRLSQFSADIAHELRTPINNLRGEAEVALARERPPGEYRQVLESSLEECHRLSQLIENLLFLARAEHPEAQIRKEHVDVEQELEALREFYEASALEKGISLSVDRQGAVPADVDKTLFRRAIGNLVENALAYTPREGVVVLNVKGDGTSVLVGVSDTGCGIPPEHLPHVFDRFYRVDRARSASGGMGLGLALVKSIAELHGGSVKIESQAGRGTRVSWALPKRTGPA